MKFGTRKDNTDTLTLKVDKTLLERVRRKLLRDKLAPNLLWPLHASLGKHIRGHKLYCALPKAVFINWPCYEVFEGIQYYF